MYCRWIVYIICDIINSGRARVAQLVERPSVYWEVVWFKSRSWPARFFNFTCSLHTTEGCTKNWGLILCTYVYMHDITFKHSDTCLCEKGHELSSVLFWKRHKILLIFRFVRYVTFIVHYWIVRLWPTMPMKLIMSLIVIYNIYHHISCLIIFVSLIFGQNDQISTFSIIS